MIEMTYPVSKRVKVVVLASPVALVLIGLLLVLPVELVVGGGVRGGGGHEAVGLGLHVVRDEVRGDAERHLAHGPPRVVRQVRGQRADAQGRLPIQQHI